MLQLFTIRWEKFKQTVKYSVIFTHLNSAVTLEFFSLSFIGFVLIQKEKEPSTIVRISQVTKSSRKIGHIGNDFSHFPQPDLKNFPSQMIGIIQTRAGWCDEIVNTDFLWKVENVHFFTLDSGNMRDLEDKKIITFEIVYSKFSIKSKRCTGWFKHDSRRCFECWTRHSILDFIQKITYIYIWYNLQLIRLDELDNPINVVKWYRLTTRFVLTDRLVFSLIFRSR